MSDVLGIDIGGTFTDIILLGRDGALVEKVPSTPDAPARAIADGIRVLRDRHGVDLSRIGLFCHGSTVATNALLEGKLPRTALIVTAGFRDVLEIGSMMRPSLFDLRVAKPAPIVPRQRVFEVVERVDREGKVDLPLTEPEIARVVAELRAAEVEAVAICLLFSFYNPSHERALAAAVAAALPEVSVTVSSEVAPEINEYPRASTTAISGALTPLVARYVSQIEGSTVAEGLAAPLYVMQSSGGVMTAEETSVNAHRMILSGPAAGVLAAQRLAELSGHRNMITFDMGGTSTDICLIKEGRADLERESMFEGRPLLVPQFAIHTIGAGGGSLARVDAAGLLRVGPESAGAMPGPACYGRGGTRPTVTDAHAVLGRIDPDRFLGGDMRLDIEAAQRAVQTEIADPLGLSIEEAAQGILDIADAAMARGVRVVSVNKGYDPRDFALVPFGGAGGMHALTVGALVEVSRVVVPPRPGIFSAVGLASSDVKYDFIRTIERPLDRVGAGGVAAILVELGQEAATRLAARLPADVEVETRRTARLRYMMQDNKVELPLPESPIDETAVAALVAEFHEAHRFQFGHNNPEGRIELVSLGVEAFGRLGRGDLPRHSATAPEEPARRQVHFRETGWTEVPILRRVTLAPGSAFIGPAIVEEREATIIVTPGVSAEVDAHGNLLLTRDLAGEPA